MDVLKKIEETKIVPVVVLKSVEELNPMLNALRAGDIYVAEICFRTACAIDCIKIASKEFSDMIIGAGTVINKEQCISAIDAGAKFIVSPGFSDSVFEICDKRNIPYLPGAITPTEIMHAIDKGINIIKYFPAGEFGGLKSIKALGAAFPQVKFMPTGGINNDNLKEFIVDKKIFACGGSWVTKGTYEEITRTCLDARKIIEELN